MNCVPETTADGSVTLYIADIQEHYHSVKGALTEALHVYIGCGLGAVNKTEVTLFEVGFGTGLNALLTAIAADKTHKKITYISIEKYPLTWQESAPLGYDTLVEQAYAPLWQKMIEAPWNCDVTITSYFTLHKMIGDLTTLPTLSIPIDLVYFDAFAPEKQPQLWEEKIFYYLYSAMQKGGVLTTYCAKGAIRRILQAVGFTVERLTGPVGGKREILRATVR